MIMKKVIDYLKIEDKVPDIEEKISRHRSLSPEDFDTYFSKKKLVEKLINDYKEHGDIIVAFDFDDTVKPSQPQNNCFLVIELLQVCSHLGFTMICFTARSTRDDIEDVKKELSDLNIRCDCINEDCPRIQKEWNLEVPHKILYSIFLDDRAGLRQAYEALWEFVDWFLDQRLVDVTN